VGLLLLRRGSPVPEGRVTGSSAVMEIAKSNRSCGKVPTNGSAETKFLMEIVNSSSLINC
jgi:hypothetical protein